MSSHLKNTNLYHVQSFYLKETLKPIELDSINELDDTNKSINSILLEKIKNKLGNKCNENGYIDKDSIQIISRSIGNINTAHFNGEIIFNIEVKAKVCLPIEGTQIKCTVIGKNKIGIYAILKPLHIILAVAHHDNPNIFSDIKENSNIIVEIINYKFKLNDDKISVVGKFIRSIK